MPDVFISYKKEERGRCEAFADALRSLGLDVWFDVRIDAGTSFDREIEAAIRDAKAVLVLWSTRSADSDWVRAEARVGKRGNKLVAIRLDDCEPPLEFMSVQMVDFFDSTTLAANPNWPRVLDRIGTLVGQAGLGDYARSLQAGRSPGDVERDQPGDHRDTADEAGRFGRAVPRHLLWGVLAALVVIVGTLLYFNGQSDPDEPRGAAGDQEIAIPQETGEAAADLPAAVPAASQEPEPRPATDDSREMVLHTPWLGLTFEQAGQPAPMYRSDLLTTEVHLSRTPFTLVMPVRGEDDTYWVTAWTDDSIFAAAQPDIRAAAWREIGLPIYFSAGTGMADTAAGSGMLFINNEAHHHLYGLRLGPERDRHTFNISQILNRGREYPVSAQSAPLYLVAWFDEGDDEMMRHGEYEFLVIYFDLPAR